MTKLFIPQVGTQLTLINHWNCKVFNEYRNKKVFTGLSLDLTQLEKDTNINITFPKGTIFRVDRVYVRAPASSFDSITFTIVSCPIKTLNKARFWVKLSEANQLEFEEFVVDMDFHTKLKDLYRFVAIKNEYPNSEYLKHNDKVLVAKEIFDYFSAKNNQIVKMNFQLNSEQFFQTIHLQPIYNMQYENTYKTIMNIIHQYLGDEFIHLSLSFLPVLDGWVCLSEPNQTAISIDKELGFYGQTHKYLREKPLGSVFSYFFCDIDLNKKIPVMVENYLKNFETTHFEYQNKPITFKDRKEFDKFLKSIKH
jgi:hypothetical protein